MALTEEGLKPIPALASRWVRLPSGAKAHYATTGTTGPDVVLLHGGFPGSSGIAGWALTATFLGENGFRVHCPDMPAFGLTEDASQFYAPGPRGHLDFLHDFATALCLDRFHLAGNSMGCTNTVNYVVAHPARVISFILVAGLIGDLAPREDLLKLPESRHRAQAVAFDGTEESMRAALETLVRRPDAIDDDLVRMRTLAANLQAAAFKRHADAAFDQAANDRVSLTTRGRFDRLGVPGLYLYGKDDAGYPVAWGYAQEDVLPNVQFFYPADCGHQGQTDQPDMFNQVFLEFFRDSKVTRRTADWAGVSQRRPEISALVEGA